MREVYTLCRPFVLLARQRTGVGLTGLSIPPEGGEPGTGTAVCARCGLSEEIASRLGGGEVDPGNEKWYCKPCWDDFYAANAVATALDGDQQQQTVGEGEDSSNAIAMTTDMEGAQQNGGTGVTTDTGNGAQASSREEHGQAEERA